MKPNALGRRRKLLLKAFDAGLLVDGREKWGTYGHDQADLFTVFRYGDLHYPFDGRDYTWQEMKDFARTQFRRFIDGTWLDRFAPFVDAVETWNEHTDSDMCRNPGRLRLHLLAEEAAVAVWEAEYRGRIVPDTCRLVIVNSPVGNDIPMEFYRLAVASGNILGIHNYTRWWQRVREVEDFFYLSGRPFYNEAEYGIKPVYAATECGPFASVDEGWMDVDVLGGSIPLMVEANRQVIRDIKRLPVFAEDRLLGFAYFTSGHIGWEGYQMEAPALIEVCRMQYDEWVGDVEDDMDDATKTAIKGHAQAIIDLVDGKWWLTMTPPYKLAATGRMIPFYNADGTRRTAAPTQLAATGNWDVFNRSGDLLLVYDPAGTAADLWVRGQDVEPLLPAG